MLVFSPVPGKVGYAGGIVVDADERGVGTASEASDDAGAREYFLRNVAKSPWAVREMISLRSRPAARPISHSFEFRNERRGAVFYARISASAAFLARR